MGSTYTIVLDGYTFLDGELPFRGPLEEFSPQVWARQNVIGTADPGTVLTFMGTTSQEWDFVSRASTTTKDKLLAVYNAQTKVIFKTPQNPTTGFTVLMTRLRIQHETPIENTAADGLGKFLCEFTLVKR